ncbi:MAG: hypothetical protein AAF767_09020 [Pseudomonadota bacterium]
MINLGDLISLFIGLLASSQAVPSTEFQLPNGTSLPLHEKGTLQNGCEIIGRKLPPDPRAVCVEFPASVLSDEVDPVNWYGQRLIERGFEGASGAANQYWFNWPTQSQCYRRLNVTGLSKERLEGGNCSDMKVFVVAFEFETDERCEEM